MFGSLKMACALSDVSSHRQGGAADEIENATLSSSPYDTTVQSSPNQHSSSDYDSSNDLPGDFSNDVEDDVTYDAIQDVTYQDIDLSIDGSNGSNSSYENDAFNGRSNDVRNDATAMTWTEWRECSVTCGGGQQWRRRSCPQLRHPDCLGPDLEFRPCNVQPCADPVKGQGFQEAGNVHSWSQWSACSNLGVAYRHHPCLPPDPMPTPSPHPWPHLPRQLDTTPGDCRPAVELRPCMQTEAGEDTPEVRRSRVLGTEDSERRQRGLYLMTSAILGFLVGGLAAAGLITYVRRYRKVGAKGDNSPASKAGGDNSRRPGASGGSCPPISLDFCNVTSTYRRLQPSASACATPSPGQPGPESGGIGMGVLGLPGEVVAGPGSSNGQMQSTGGNDDASGSHHAAGVWTSGVTPDTVSVSRPGPSGNRRNEGEENERLPHSPASPCPTLNSSPGSPSSAFSWDPNISSRQNLLPGTEPSSPSVWEGSMWPILSPSPGSSPQTSPHDSWVFSSLPRSRSRSSGGGGPAGWGSLGRDRRRVTGTGSLRRDKMTVREAARLKRNSSMRTNLNIDDL